MHCLRPYKGYMPAATSALTLIATVLSRANHAPMAILTYVPVQMKRTTNNSMLPGGVQLHSTVLRCMHIHRLLDNHIPVSVTVRTE